MKKLNDKKQVVAQISAAARLYKKNLVGKHFLYVFDGRAIEVAYQAKGFRHLTGVDTGLDAMSFYKKAVSGTLQANQIFFSSHHPYQLCQRKLVLKRFSQQLLPAFWRIQPQIMQVLFIA